MKKNPESLEQTILIKLLQGDDIPMSLSPDFYYKTSSGYATKLRAWPYFGKPHSFPAS